MNGLVERGLHLELVALGEVPALLLTCMKLCKFLNLFVCFFICKRGLL